MVHQYLLNRAGQWEDSNYLERERGYRVVVGGGGKVVNIPINQYFTRKTME